MLSLDVDALSARSEDNRLRLSSGSGIFSVIVDVIAFIAVVAIAVCFYLVAAAIVVVVVAIAVIVVATIVFADEGAVAPRQSKIVSRRPEMSGVQRARCPACPVFNPLDIGKAGLQVSYEDGEGRWNEQA